MSEQDDKEETWVTDEEKDTKTQGISLWLAITIFVVLVVVIFYFYQKAYISKRESMVCWKFVKTGKVAAPEH